MADLDAGFPGADFIAAAPKGGCGALHFDTALAQLSN